MDFAQMKTKEIETILQQTDDTALPELVQTLQQDSRKAVQNLAAKYLRQMEKREKERQRIAAMWDFEKRAKAKGFQWIVGTDEAFKLVIYFDIYN